MKVIGLYNLKGGVGKTAAAVNFSYLSSKKGFKTLIWDLDPQGAATYYFNQNTPSDFHLKKIIHHNESLSGNISKTEFPLLSIIPSSFSFRKIDALLDDVKKSKKRLNEIIKHSKVKFDFVFLDCPPGLSLLAENIFFASDYILCPLVPSPLSIRSYEQIVSYYIEHELDLSKIIPFLSMVETRRKLHKESITELQEKIPNLCHKLIPYLSDIEKMGIHRKPVNSFSPACKASKAFESLWEEIFSKIK